VRGLEAVVAVPVPIDVEASGGSSSAGDDGNEGW